MNMNNSDRVKEVLQDCFPLWTRCGAPGQDPAGCAGPVECVQDRECPMSMWEQEETRLIMGCSLHWPRSNHSLGDQLGRKAGGCAGPEHREQVCLNAALWSEIRMKWFFEAELVKGGEKIIKLVRELSAAHSIRNGWSQGVPLGSFNRKLSQEQVPAGGGGGGRTTKMGS